MTATPPTSGAPPGALSFDPQVNGYGGVDFQQDDLRPEDLLHACDAWRRDGGSRLLLTLITDAWDPLLARLQHLSEMRRHDDRLRTCIAGFHVEGPFLSDRPGFHGAHDPAHMRDPSPSAVRELREAAPGVPFLLTLAPERHGALESVAAAVACGMRVSLGHTDAAAGRISEAVAAGATGFTHLGNGCPQALDRHDNILWRVLDTPGLHVGLIPDGMHVSPVAFRLVHRLVPPDRLYYTTDAMSAAGASPGTYRLGCLRLQVGDDGVVRQPGATHFAGSSLRPDLAGERAAAMLGGAERIPAGALGPTAARWLGLEE